MRPDDYLKDSDVLLSQTVMPLVVAVENLPRV